MVCRRKQAGARSRRRFCSEWFLAHGRQGLERRSLAAPALYHILPYLSLPDFLADGGGNAMASALAATPAPGLAGPAVAPAVNAGPPLAQGTGLEAMLPAVVASASPMSPSAVSSASAASGAASLSGSPALFLVDTQTSPYPGILEEFTEQSPPMDYFSTVPNVGITQTTSDQWQYPAPEYGAGSDTTTASTIVYSPGDTTTGGTSLLIVANNPTPDFNSPVSHANIDTITQVSVEPGTWYHAHTSLSQSGTSPNNPVPILWNIAPLPATGTLTIAGRYEVSYSPPGDQYMVQGAADIIDFHALTNLLNTDGTTLSSQDEVDATMVYDPTTNQNTTLDVTYWSGGQQYDVQFPSFSGHSSYGVSDGIPYAPTVMNWSVSIDLSQAPGGVQQSVQYLSFLRTINNTTSDTGTTSTGMTWAYSIDSMSVS